MKKILVILLLILAFPKQVFAKDYYFKDCKINNVVMGNYIIDLEKNVILVELKASNGTVQNFADKIKSIKKNKIISEKIESARGEELYYQYFLNAKTKSVTKMQYKKESGIDIDVFNLQEKRESICLNVKSDWNKKKIDKDELDKEKKQILKVQEQLKKEQSGLIKCQDTDSKEWTNCKGILTTGSGRKYEGIFLNGKIFKGVSLYLDGAKYIGEFKDFKPHGFGTFVWKNGDKYYGQWKDGKANGSGTKTWKDGRKYLGEFKNDKMHGSGTLFYLDGKKYVGEFLNGKRHGKGTFSYSDGSAYIGDFIAGQEKGVGECVDKTGLITKCKSKDDVKVENFTAKNMKKISITAKKWVRISQYESNTKKAKKVSDKLKIDFENKALELCQETGKYKVLRKRIEVLDIDETPAYGLETKLLLGINGAVECI